GAMVPPLGGPAHHHAALLQLDGHVRMALADQAALRPLHLHRAAGHLDLHALGNRNGRPPYSRHRNFLHPLHPQVTGPHHTYQLTSPPTPSRLACRSVITPRHEVRITTPIPPRT